MQSFLKYLLMIVSVSLIVLCLLQSEKGESLGSSVLGTESLSLFTNKKERGMEKTVSVATLVLGIAFFAIVFVLYMMGA